MEETSFETARMRLQQVVEKLEGGDLTLEEALSLYEQGQALARYCQEQLDRAEVRITELSGPAENPQ
jgi:exodeoxyribonuclease VII small subunit